MFSDLFYTLFKYKEKALKDELGNYPEKVNVRAFPERRFLWTSRFFVIVSCLSLCVSMILGSVLCIMIPQRKMGVFLLQIDYQLHQVTQMQKREQNVYAGDLITESLMSDYITRRYTIGDNFEEMQYRWNKNSFIELASDENVYKYFEQTERPYFELLQKQGVRRTMEIEKIYPVSFDFWQVRFRTIDVAPDMPMIDLLDLLKINVDTLKEIPEQGTPIINKWIATLRMNFNFAKYENKELGLINPFGLTIYSYDLSYAGNNLKSKR